MARRSCVVAAISEVAVAKLWAWRSCGKLDIANPQSCFRVNALEQLSDRLKPATVLNLLIRCQKRSLLIISLFFNDKVTLLYS